MIRGGATWSRSSTCAAARSARPSRGAPTAAGRWRTGCSATAVVCPLHNRGYCLTTGEGDLADEPITTFPARVEGDGTSSSRCPSAARAERAGSPDTPQRDGSAISTGGTVSAPSRWNSPWLGLLPAVAAARRRHSSVASEPV